MYYNDQKNEERQDPLYVGPEGKLKILLVDDQPIHIQVLFEILGLEYQVFMATSGDQALKICQDNPPDIILLDVQMPGMDGFELCTELKRNEQTSTIPVIFLTGQNSPEHETQGLELGAVDFISKPVNPAIVKARVKTHLTMKMQAEIMRLFLDGMTGVYNRPYFDQQLNNEMARAQRKDSPLAVMKLDIDFFTRYNDRYGHLAGDERLRQIVKAFRGGLRRSTDLLARYGGGTFACLLPETDYVAAMLLATELQQVVRKLNIPHEGSDIAKCVTISVGVAVWAGSNTSSINTLLSHADGQLYKAKVEGRGRVYGCTV